MLAIDISPLDALAGAVLADEAQPPGLDGRLFAWLRDERILAAVDRTPTSEPTDRVFRVATDAEGHVQRLDADGRLAAGPRADDVAAALSAALGAEVVLTWAEQEDLDTSVPDEQVGVPDEDVELDPAETFGDAFGVDIDEEPHRVLLFSRRGLALGAYLAWRVHGVVEAGRAGDWSVFRYLDSRYTEPPTPSRRELPSITVVVTDEDGPFAHAYVEVTTRAASLRDVVQLARGSADHAVPLGAQYVLFPRENAGMRPVFAPDELVDARAAEVQRVLVDDALAAGSTLQALAADPAFAATVDRARLQRALAPDGADLPVPSLERIRLLLTALGLPGALVDAALTDERLPEAQVFEPTGVVGAALRLAQDGVAGVRPLGVPPGPWGRVDEAVRRRPRLAAAVATAEALAGGAMLLVGLRLRRRTRLGGAAVTAAGALIVADALVDAILVRRRSLN